MRAIATDVVTYRGLSVCLSVCLVCVLLTPVSSAETAEPIKIPLREYRLACVQEPLDGVHMGTTWRIRLNIRARR